MLLGGQASWHPDPDLFFADGAGPLLDMGPYYLTAIVALLGPVRSVAGFASVKVDERTIEIGPRAGEVFRASTPSQTYWLGAPLEARDQRRRRTTFESRAAARVRRRRGAEDLACAGPDLDRPLVDLHRREAGYASRTGPRSATIAVR